MGKGFIIAIDGPVASGKGTIAKELAKRLNAFNLPTGSFYRAVALYCIQNNIDIHEEQKVAIILPNIHITLDGEKTLINGKDVTQQLRDKQVDQIVSIGSNYKSVRQYMTPLQQKLGRAKVEEGKIVIAESRDTATKVFSNAEIKIFLTASVEKRAERRLEQLKKMGVHNRSLAEVQDDLKKRDELDMFGPLRNLTTEPEKFGYIIIDDSYLTEEETLERILNTIRDKKLL